MTRRNPIPTIITILYIVLLSQLKNKYEYIDNIKFIILALVGVILIQLIYYKLVTSKKISKIRELRKHQELLHKNPILYIEKIDELLLESNGYERDYLTLHKANVYSNLGKNKEAIEILKGHKPIHLDQETMGIYYSNLLGLYLQENRIEEANKLYLENEALLKKMEKNIRVGYSALINRAVLYYRQGDKENANLYLDKAKKQTRKEMHDEIEKLRDKFV